MAIICKSLRPIIKFKIWHSSVRVLQEKIVTLLALSTYIACCHFIVVDLSNDLLNHDIMLTRLLSMVLAITRRYDR